MFKRRTRAGPRRVSGGGLSLVLLQTLAYGAAATWLYTAWQLVETRQVLGQKWALAAAILGAVALVSLLAGLLLNSRVMRERYPR